MSDSGHDDVTSFPGQGEGSSQLREDDVLEEKWRQLAAREGRAVAIARTIVLTTIVLATTVVVRSIRGYIRSDQREDFENTFVASAERILESFHRSIDRRLQAVDALSVDFTSFAKETGQEFPFVRLPDYDVRAANARVLGESYVINFFPLVKEVQREEWNRQTVDNPSFVNDFYNNEVAADTTQRLAQDQRFAEGERKLQEMPPRGISPVRPTPEGLYLPGIQFSPAIPDPTFIVNYDAYSAPEALDVYKTSVQTGRAALGPAFVDLSNENYNIYLNYLYSLSQYRDRAEKIAADPTSTLAYPVFDSFNVDDREVVGTLGLNLNWRTIFSRTLPSNVVGVYCIIQNTFNQTLSFIVDGSVVVYLGVGDMHEPAYNHMVQQESMNDYLANHVSKETRSYTSVGLDSNYSDFKLYVYPSSRMEGSFTDQSPLLFTLTIVGVFFFTSMLFVVYDFMVGRRQRTIMRQAVKSSELVSSLFPSQIRDQLYEQNEQKKRPVRGDDADDHDQVGMMERFSRQRKSPGSSKHIASLFENTTVMFADLAGFTAWCSKRAPEDVFHLLEALFSKFDAAAKRRRVFKVETIGDCYLAVTGLPDPQPLHAVMCAKFAHSCLRYTHDVIHSLVDTLGQDTAGLELRIGLHSGPVTAGVLRSDRARFQLFGDTVNTASRMETTGEPGKIHVSEETAREIAAKGMGHWLTRREDMVVAKGKGELSTYWLTVGSLSSSMGTDSVTSDDDDENEDENEDEDEGGSNHGSNLIHRAERCTNDQEGSLEIYLRNPSAIDGGDDESSGIGSFYV